MALDIDTHYALRTPAELRALVEAVRRAAPTDEPEAVEWKGQVDDVASKKWMVEVAKQIIGMANRDPATAQLTFEGCGYLLLGVEPGAVPGVRALDHADVENKTAPYLGGQGLRWTWINLTVGRQTVAVVTVEAPRWGDPIFCFQSGYSPINPGAIFLRRPGKTEPPDASDIARLTERVRRSATRLDVVLSLHEPAAVMLCVADSPADLDAWVADEVRRMQEDAQRVTATSARTVSRLSDTEVALASIRTSFERSFIEQDTRSLEDYMREVDAWAHVARGRLSAYVRDRAPRVRPVAPLRPLLHNATDRNFTSVRVEVRVKGDVTGHLPQRSGRKRATLPARPRPFGPRVHPIFTAGLGHFPGLVTPPPEVVWVDNQNSVRVRFFPVDLRPHHHVELPPFWLVGGPGLAGGDTTVA